MCLGLDLVIAGWWPELWFGFCQAPLQGSLEVSRLQMPCSSRAPWSIAACGLRLVLSVAAGLNFLAPISNHRTLTHNIHSGAFIPTRPCDVTRELNILFYVCAPYLLNIFLPQTRNPKLQRHL